MARIAKLWEGLFFLSVHTAHVCCYKPTSIIPISITFFTCTPKSKKNISIGLGDWIDHKNLRDRRYILRQDYKCSRYYTFIKYSSVFIEQVYHVLTIYVRWFQQIVTVAFYSTVDPPLSPSDVRSSIIGFLSNYRQNFPKYSMGSYMYFLNFA